MFFLILINLPTANIILLKQPYCISMHDHFINAIGSQRLLNLCLLDVSALCDTNDDSIIIIHLLSEFYHGSLLNWFYSTYRPALPASNVINTNYKYISSCGVPRVSILGPLRFVIYPTSSPLSAPLNHRLYADDNQLFTSPCNFHSISPTSSRPMSMSCHKFHVCKSS